MRVIHFGLVRPGWIDPQCGSWRRGNDWSASWEVVTCPWCYRRRDEIARMDAPSRTPFHGGSPMADVEKEAQMFFKDLMQKGHLKELSALVRDLSKQDWSVTTIRVEGMRRAMELRGLSGDLQRKAAAFLGVATRKQIENLSKELGGLARRIDTTGRAPNRRRAAAPLPTIREARDGKGPAQDR